MADELSPAMSALYAEGREAGEALLPPDAELTVFEAAAFGRLERLAELLAARPELVNGFSGDGFTPLHLACFSGGPRPVRLLVERGADLEALARSSFAQVRPLGTAAFSRDRESAAVLLEAGADPNGRGEGGFTPLHSAAHADDVEMARLLLAHGADPALVTDDGRDSARIAADDGSTRVAELLRG
jgi:uncharacterized protein